MLKRSMFSSQFKKKKEKKKKKRRKNDKKPTTQITKLPTKKCNTDYKLSRQSSGEAEEQRV